MGLASFRAAHAIEDRWLTNSGRDKTMGAVMAAWLVEVGIISVRDFTASKRPPLPSELLATFVVFGGLGLLSESATVRGAAGATAWGIVVATLLSSRVDFLRPVGNFFAGTAGTAPPSGAAALPVGTPTTTNPNVRSGGPNVRLVG